MTPGPQHALGARAGRTTFVQRRAIAIERPSVVGARDSPCARRSADAARVPRSRRRPLTLLVSVLTLVLAGAAPALAARDPLLARQWALGAPGVGAAVAWTQSLGQGVVVAILDSGVQLDHPDLAANLWTNPGEIAGNGVDDDRNGFVDDVHGASMLDASGNAGDDDGHGTHVAGIVAAAAGNGIGGSGLAPRARIMSVKVLDAKGACTASLLARGIRYAVDAGARILNVSVNGDTTAQDLDEAIAYAGARGATIVASAGNDGRDLDRRPSFPAASPDPAVLSVTASGRRGGVLRFANRGSATVDLAAPGERILSTARGSGFEERSGTSMAAPYVSGALALLASARPDLGQAQLRDVLRASALRPRPLLGLLGWGELDVGAAMHAILPGSMWHEAPADAPPPPATRPRLRLRVAAAVRAGREATVRWSATAARNVTRWSIYLDVRRVATRSSRRAPVLRKRIDRPGLHRWKVVGFDAIGVRVASAVRPFRVLRAR
jgi:subtilisin family serine protease